ncbi:MAG: hypothetical protein HXS47_13645 [Theionarchaea archaeon]|nr:hypothetical protein [Theionarchaea archaeon]
MKKLNAYDLLTCGVIGLFTIITLIRFDIYPVFVDIYYHLSVAVSFENAGGIVLWDFWEFAPVGRPHLYPPLLHSLMLLGSECVPSLTVAKVVSFIMFPASQVTLWIFSREIYSRKTGFYAVLLLSSSEQYFQLQAVTSAAALVLVLLPLLFLAFQKNKYIASIILLTACLYTHVGMGPIALFSFALYTVSRKKWEDGLKIIIPSLLLFIPWGLHLLIHNESLSANSPPSGGGLMIFLWILGIIGVYFSLKRKKEFLIPICILICMIPIAFTYLGRFTGHAILPLAMLSGITLSRIDDSLNRNQKIGWVLASLLIFSIIAPTIALPRQQRTMPLPQNNPIRLPIQQLRENREPPTQNPQSQNPQLPPAGKNPPNRPIQPSRRLQLPSLLLMLPRRRSDSYLTPDNLKMAEIIKNNSTEAEIVFIPGGMMGCFVTATTGRPQTFGMWQEVSSDYQPDPKSAALFVTSKEMQVPRELIPLGETQRWAVYRAPFRKTVDIPAPTINKYLIYVLLFIALMGLLYDGMVKR